MKRLLWLLLPSLLPGQSNWSMPAEVAALGYSMKAMHDGCKSDTCVVLIPPANPPAQPPGALSESLGLTEVRGRRIRLRAWVRLEHPGPGDRAQLWLRVDRLAGVLGFYDTMGDRPITSPEWRSYEIVGEVAADAAAVSLGVRSAGKAPVWVDGASVERLPPAGPETSVVRDEIARIYARVDAAYDAGDVDSIAAIAVRDAEVVINESRMPLAGALAAVREQIAKGAKFRSVSAITAIRVTGAEAMVWVNNESTIWLVDAPRSVVSVNRDVWVKIADVWKLKQSTVIATNAAK
jgi:SnoaL-like protein